MICGTTGCQREVEWHANDPESPMVAVHTDDGSVECRVGKCRLWPSADAPWSAHPHAKTEFCIGWTPCTATVAS